MGWVRPPTRTPALEARHAFHIGATAMASYPAEYDAPWPYWGMDQSIEESCTMRTGVGDIFALKGVKCDVYVPWADGRHYDNPGKPLANVGVSVDGLMHGLEKAGAARSDTPPDRGWRPGSPGFSINEEPPALVCADAVSMLLEIVPIYASGQAAIDQMCVALSSRLPGSLVMECDDGMWTPRADGYVPPESGSSRGSHRQRLRGYKFVDGKRCFICEGSWGPKYGVNGVTFVDEARVAESAFISFTRRILTVNAQGVWQ